MVRNFNPDLIIARCQPFAFHCAKILGIKSISFSDTEHARINYYLCYPFADKIVTPSCFQGNFGRRHEKYGFGGRVGFRRATDEKAQSPGPRWGALRVSRVLVLGVDWNAPGGPVFLGPGGDPASMAVPPLDIK